MDLCVPLLRAPCRSEALLCLVVQQKHMFTYVCTLSIKDFRKRQIPALYLCPYIGEAQGAF